MSRAQGAGGVGGPSASAPAGGKGQAAAAPAPTRSEEASLRELVESCLANDDFTPVLRILFSVPSADAPTAGSAFGPPAPASTSPPRPDPASASASAPGGAALLDGKPPLELLQDVLRSVAAEQDGVVHEVCSSNAMEIATCVAELDRMAAAAAGLQGQVAAGGEALQRTGERLAGTARELHALLSAQRHLAAAVGGARAVRRLLGRCARVGELLAQRRLFAALQLLEGVRAHDLALALDVLGGSPHAAMMLAAGGEAAAGAAAAAAVAAAAAREGGGPPAPSPAIPPRHQAAVARLRGFLQGLVSDLEAAVEYFALAEFNNWLMGVRSESRSVGLRAIRQAAIARQLREDLAAERRKVAAGLMAVRDVGAVAARTVLGAPFRRELEAEGAPAPAGAGAGQGGGRGLSRGSASRSASSAAALAAAGPPPDLATVHPGQPLQAAQALLARHRAAAALPPPPTCVLSDATTALLQGVDMQGLHRAVHIHRLLGRLPALRRYYAEQRRRQITTDLAPPPNFLEAYQTYLAQVAGFFVVEDAVLSAAPDLLPSPDAAALLWEAAAASLRGVLGRALEEALGGTAPASIMLLLKDFMLLVCSALGERGFATGLLTELLAASRPRYHDLLTASVALRVGRALADDPLAEGHLVGSAAAAEELAGRLGLPASLEGGGGYHGGGTASWPAVPYRAPYTPCLPRILNAVRSFVSDSLAYLQGLLSPWELLPAVLQARDRLIAKTVVDALADHTARLLGSGVGPGGGGPPQQQQQQQQAAAAAAWRAREVMRMVANAWCLAAAMQALDEWTLLQVRPLGAMAAAAAAAAASGASSGGAPAPLSLLAAAGTGAPSPSSASGAGRLARGGGEHSSQPQSTDAPGSPPAPAAAPAPHQPSASDAASSSTAASSSAVLSALRAVQDGGERGLLRLLSARVEALVEGGGRGLVWLPPGPLPPGNSPHVDELLALLRDTFDSAAATLPRPSFLFLARAVVRAMGNAFMHLMREGVKAYNLFAVERLAADCSALDRLVASLPVPNLAAEFAEPRQLCALLLSPKVEEVLIPEVRRQRYPALGLPGLVVVLERYREAARVGKERTGHVTRRAVDGVCRQLRAQMVAGTATSGPRVLEDI